MRLIHSRVGGCAIPHPFPLPQHHTQALMYDPGRVWFPLTSCQSWLERRDMSRGDEGCWAGLLLPSPLDFLWRQRLTEAFVYLFHDYVYELPEFMRSEVKWKATVHRSSERLKFVKPRKWQDSAKWKVKSQVKGSAWMKVSSLSASQTTHPSGSTLTSSTSECSLSLIPWHKPGQEMGWAGITQIRLQHCLWWCHLRVNEVDSILGLRWILTRMNFELFSQHFHRMGQVRIRSLFLPVVLDLFL